MTKETQPQRGKEVKEDKPETESQKPENAFQKLASKMQKIAEKLAGDQYFEASGHE